MSGPNYGYPATGGQPPPPYGAPPQYAVNPGRKSGGIWKWVVSIVLVLLLLLVVFVCGIFWLIERGMGNSRVVTMAMERARDDARVTNKLGTPLERGWFIGGSINVSNGTGHAEMRIPVSGPRGKGKLYVTADERADVWTVGELLFRADGDTEQIQLAGPEKVYEGPRHHGTAGAAEDAKPEP